MGVVCDPNEDLANRSLEAELARLRAENDRLKIELSKEHRSFDVIYRTDRGGMEWRKCPDCGRDWPHPNPSNINECIVCYGRKCAARATSKLDRLRAENDRLAAELARCGPLDGESRRGSGRTKS